MTFDPATRSTTRAEYLRVAKPPAVKLPVVKLPVVRLPDVAADPSRGAANAARERVRKSRRFKGTNLEICVVYYRISSYNTTVVAGSGNRRETH